MSFKGFNNKKILQYLRRKNNLKKTKPKTSHGQPAARGPHAALEALKCGPSTDF